MRCRLLGSIVLAVAVGLVTSGTAAAQNEDALRAYFEGKRVTLKIDMPGTSDGVDLRADSGRALDTPRYGDRLKTYGAALHRGESVSVTLVKLKKDLIEFQLNGGGYGTFGDDTSTSVSLKNVEKSVREKDLEKQIEDEKDSRRRERLKDELEELRSRRERENRRIDAERVRLEELKKERLAERRLKGGSRFNIRYTNAVPPGIRPEEVMAALGEYIDFSNGPVAPAPGPPSPAGGVRLPRKGMLRADAEEAFGRPTDASERREGSLTVTRLRFVTGDQRIDAEFVEDVLIRYTISSR